MLDYLEFNSLTFSVTNKQLYESFDIDSNLKKVLLENYVKKIKESKGFVVLKLSKLTPNESNAFRKEIFD